MVSFWRFHDCSQFSFFVFECFYLMFFSLKFWVYTCNVCNVEIPTTLLMPTLQSLFRIKMMENFWRISSPWSCQTGRVINMRFNWNRYMARNWWIKQNFWIFIFPIFIIIFIIFVFLFIFAFVFLFSSGQCQHGIDLIGILVC